MRKVYYRRVRLTLRTNLNSQNGITTMNIFAIAVLQYSFNILYWILNGIRQMDSKSRLLLSKHNIHHPKAATDRLYMPVKEGERCHIQLEPSYKTTCIGLLTYMERTRDWIKLIKQHENRKRGRKHSVENKKRTSDDNVVAEIWKWKLRSNHLNRCNAVGKIKLCMENIQLKLMIKLTIIDGYEYLDYR